MLSKISVAIKAILNDLKGVKADISELKAIPRPRKGEPGKDAVAPELSDIVAAVLEKVRMPEDGLPGKDALPVDVDAVAFKVLGQMPAAKPGKDAVAPAMADIINAVMAEIRIPEDGHTPDVNAIIKEVLAQMPAPEVVKAIDGKPGAKGKNGASVTKVKLEKGNKLAVWIDGVRRVVGTIEVPKPTSFTPGSGGGGTRKVTEVPKDTVGYTPQGTFASEDLQAGQEDIAQTVLFGAGGTIATGSATVGTDGVITVNKASFFSIKQRFRAGRSGASGVSEVFFWAEISVDGGSTWDVLGSSVDILLSNSSDTIVFFDLSNLQVPAGTKLRNRFARSSTGDNSGDLRPATPSAALQAIGVLDAPSAQITFYEIVQ